MAPSFSTRNNAFHTLIAALILLALLAGAGFRLWHITSEPLWLDEAYSAYAAAHGFDFLWHVVPRYETHPPFYYSLLRVWTLGFGDGLAGLRSLGALCGLATIAAMAVAAREIARGNGLDRPSRTAFIVIGVSLAAVSPTLVQMTREVRPYPVLILVYCCAIAAIFRLNGQIDRGGRLANGSYYVYLLALELTLWLHNLGALFATTMGLALLLLCVRSDWSKRDWIYLIIGHAVVLLFWLPAVIILVDQAPTWVQSTWLHFPPAGLLARITTLFVVPQTLSIAAGFLLFCFALAHCAVQTASRRSIAALLLLALLPLAISLIVSATITPIFIVRTMTPITVPAILLLALGAATARNFRRPITIGCILILIGQMATADVQRRKNGPQQKWYAATDWLAQRYQPDDMVYAYPNEGALPFERAIRDRGLPIRTRAIPGPIPALNPPPGSWFVSGSRGVPSLDQPHLRAIAEEPGTRSIPTIWLLRLGPWAYDKGDVFLEELTRDRAIVGHFTSGPIDIIGLRREYIRSDSQTQEVGKR